MRTEDVFPSRWLHGSDLPRDVTATIERVVMETTRDPKTRREKSQPVAYFVGKRKALILNVTNWRTLVKLYGDESDTWAGKRIIMGPETVDAFGDEALVVRIRAVKPNGGAPAPLQETDEDGPQDGSSGPQGPQGEPEPQAPAGGPAPAEKPAPAKPEPPAQLPSNGAQSASRPWTAPQLMGALERRALVYETEGKKATAAQLGLVMGILNEVLGGDANRHMVLGYLWGVKSAKEMSPAQTLAMHDLLKPMRVGKGEWAHDGTAAEELKAALDVATKLNDAALAARQVRAE